MAKATRDEILDVLCDVTAQSCLHGGDELDSMGLSAYADAMRLLAAEGRMIIADEYGRRVIGRFTSRGHNGE